MTLLEAAAALRERRVSSAELAAASLERINSLNGTVNAMQTVTPEAAMIQARRADTELARPFYVANLEKKLAEVRRLVGDPTARVSDFVGTTPTREQQVPIIDALVNGKADFFQVNIPNHGMLDGVADDVVVEVPAYIDRTGVHAVKPTQLPRKTMLERILPGVLKMERELEAFKTGDRTMLIYSALMSPQTRSYEQAMAVLEDLLALEGNEELAAHYTMPAGRGEAADIALTPRAGATKQEPIDAARSKQILLAIAEADWNAEPKPNGVNPRTAFGRLDPKRIDGWNPPGDSPYSRMRSTARSGGLRAIADSPERVPR